MIQWVSHTFSDLQLKSNNTNAVIDTIDIDASNTIDTSDMRNASNASDACNVSNASNAIRFMQLSKVIQMQVKYSEDVFQ